MLQLLDLKFLCIKDQPYSISRFNATYLFLCLVISTIVLWITYDFFTHMFPKVAKPTKGGSIPKKIESFYGVKSSNFKVLMLTYIGLSQRLNSGV